MSTFNTITPREASIFAAICDTLIAPGGILPAVRHTDAATALDEDLAAAPFLNRIGVRTALYVLEIAPRLMGYGARLRRLDAAKRQEVLHRLDDNALTTPLVEIVRVVSQMCYYGDLQVLRLLGYDPQVVVDRAASLRAKEGRW